MNGHLSIKVVGLSIFFLNLSINKQWVMTLHPQFIIDKEGKPVSVILPMNEFNSILEELEELDDIKLYDAAKKTDSGERYLFSDYVKKRMKKNA